jgi:uncharacterized protein YraI
MDRGAPELGKPLRSSQWRQGNTIGRSLGVAGLRMLLIVGLLVGMVAPIMVSAVLAAPAQQTGGTLAIVGASGARLYTSPGGEVVDTLAPGTVLTAVGRTADNLWVVAYNEAGAAGWAEVAEVVLFGLDQLPVMVEGSAPPAPGTTPEADAPTVALPTPTNTPPATATPTATPSPTPTMTPTPTPLPTATPETMLPARGSQAMPGMSSLVAVVRGGGANLYDRPGGVPTQTLVTGTALTAWGRSSDNQWLVVTESSGAAGWVRVEQVVVFNMTGLPVLDGSELPSAAPAVAAQPTAGTVVPMEEPRVSDATPVAPVTVDPQRVTATVSLTESRLNIRTGPGTAFPIMAKADPGAVYVVSGRNADSSWIEISVPGSGEGVGWVAAEFVVLSRPVGEVPVSARVLVSPPVATSVAVATPVAAPRVQPSVTGLSGRLAFQSAEAGTIYVYDLATGALRSLTGGLDPAISPDGSTVAFTRLGGAQGIYLIDSDGQNERRIFTGDETPRAPAWSPDGRWIAFVRVTGATTCRDVGFGLCLADNPFLAGFPLVRRPEFGLSRVDFNGENFRDLGALTSAQAPDWTSAGIVYHANPGIELTADEPDAVTRSIIQGPYHQDPAWQPNGDRIVFQRREGSHWQIFAVNSEGEGLTALTRPVTTLVDELPSSVAPAWSPDGQWIVYLSNRGEDNSAGPWRLWVMAADGSSQRPLPIDVPLEYGFGGEQVVSWGRSN